MRTSGLDHCDSPIYDASKSPKGLIKTQMLSDIHRISGPIVLRLSPRICSSKVYQETQMILFYDNILRTSGLYSWYSKCGPGSSSLGITSELVRRLRFWPTPYLLIRIYMLVRPSGYLYHIKFVSHWTGALILEQVWSVAWESALLTNMQQMPMLLLCSTHFE